MKKPSKTVNTNMTAKIRAALGTGKSVKEVAKKLGVKPAAVYQVRWRDQQEEKKTKKVETLTPKAVASLVKEKQEEADMVNHPPHYKTGGIETIDYIEAKRFGYHLGNVIKYISRANHKNGMEDLLKAQWYLNRAIDRGEV